MEWEMTVKAQVIQVTDDASAVTSGVEQTTSAFKEGMIKDTAGFQTTQARVKENVDKAMKTAEELLAFNQGTFEAVVKSGKIWSTGVQAITQQVVASAQASFEETMATYRALASVKSFNEAVELQTSLARSAMERTVSETGRITDASVKLAEQAMAPLTERLSLVVEKFARAA
jgi:phasin family protein